MRAAVDVGQDVGVSEAQPNVHNVSNPRFLTVCRTTTIHSR